MEELFEIIRSAFGALWKCRPRGSSLEVITPFATSTDMYVSVFISHRGDAWIVSDGGWMYDGVYDADMPYDDAIFRRILKAYIGDYGISETVSPYGSVFYYKSTRKPEMVANIVFELATFLSQTISAATVQYREVPERLTFKKKVKSFLTERIEGDDMRFDTYLSKEASDARFNIIVDNKLRGLSLINLVSGYDSYTLKSGFARSNLNFQLLAQTSADRQVKNRIVVIDDSIFPMESSDVGPLVKVATINGQIPMAWSSSKKELMERIA